MDPFPNVIAEEPPPYGLWSPGRVSYLKNLLELLVLALAVPYLLWKLLSDPARLLRGMGQAKGAQA